MALKVLLTTTGIQTPVNIADLGGKIFTHPTNSYDLLNEFTEAEIEDSPDLQLAIDNGWVVLRDENGGEISDVTNTSNNYDNSNSTLISNNVQDAITELDYKLNQIDTEQHDHRIEIITLGSFEITNKFLLIGSIPYDITTVQLEVRGGPIQEYGTDYEIDGINNKKVKWGGLGLDGQLSIGDQVMVLYQIYQPLSSSSSS